MTIQIDPGKAGETPALIRVKYPSQPSESIIRVSHPSQPSESAIRVHAD